MRMEGVDRDRPEGHVLTPHPESERGECQGQVGAAEALSKASKGRSLLFLGLRFVTEQEDDVGEGRYERGRIGH